MGRNFPRVPLMMKAGFSLGKSAFSEAMVKDVDSSWGLRYFGGGDLGSWRITCGDE